MCVKVDGKQKCVEIRMMVDALVSRKKAHIEKYILTSSYFT